MPSLTKQRTRVTRLFSNGELNDLLINSMIHSFESLLVYCLTGKLAERLAGFHIQPRIGLRWSRSVFIR